MDDESIDYSDIPELTPEIAKNAKFMSMDTFLKNLDITNKGKVDIHIKLDKDIVDFFKSQGKRYQTRINSLLRAYVDHEKIAH